MAVAQRLIRKVCKKCSKLRRPTAQELKQIKKELKKVPQKVKIPQVKGCQYCNFTGYRGRVGIFEAFVIDDETEDFILTSPSISALRNKVIKKGMIPMRKDGFIKVLEGITTIEEVKRITGE